MTDATLHQRLVALHTARGNVKAIKQAIQELEAPMKAAIEEATAGLRAILKEAETKEAAANMDAITEYKHLDASRLERLSAGVSIPTVRLPPGCSVSRTRAAASVDVDTLPTEYVVKSYNKTELGKALRAGADVPGVVAETRYSFRFRSEG
jgi:hypothetical protein